MKRRFRGGGDENSEGGSGGGGRAAKAETPIRVSFGLPVSSYATTLLQHLTGQGLEGVGGGREEVGEFEEEEEEEEVAAAAAGVAERLEG